MTTKKRHLNAVPEPIGFEGPRVEHAASVWLDHYRSFSRRNDLGGHPDHSGMRKTSTANGNTTPEKIAAGIWETWEQAQKDVVRLRDRKPYLQAAFSEVDVKNFMYFFRDRIADMYYASERRSRFTDTTEKPLHECPIAMQRAVVRDLAFDAIEIAHRIRILAPGVDLQKLARRNPAVYVELDSVVSAMSRRVLQHEDKKEIVQDVLRAPRLFGQEADELSKGRANHPAARFDATSPREDLQHGRQGVTTIGMPTGDIRTTGPAVKVEPHPMVHTRRGRHLGVVATDSSQLSR